MTTPERRADAQSRLRRSFTALGGARALLAMKPPCPDDAVNRASAAALHAVRALVDSQWARDSQPHWDPTHRPGMSRPPGLAAERKLSSLDTFLKLLDKFEALASNMSLPPDFTLYLRTLVEDGLDADTGEAPDYDLDEAARALQTANQLISAVASQIGMEKEFGSASASWAKLPSQPAPAA